MFGIILVSISTIVQFYVLIRTVSLPIIEKFPGKKAFIAIHFILWLSIPVARYFAHHETGIFTKYLELTGMIWLGSIFLIFISVLSIDLLTLYGFVFKKITPSLRTGAFILGILLSITAIIQGSRPPIFENYDIHISNLPKKMDGKVIIAISDLHINHINGIKWLKQIITQVQRKNPDFIFILGDTLEAHGLPDKDELITTLGKLKAPYGTWAVLGNHFFYGDQDLGLSILKKANINLLRNKWVEISPGLVLAGVDDLTIHHRKQGNVATLVTDTLKNRPDNAATILLSHTPWGTEVASKSKVNLMLSGHTHGGQIWPFDYLVKQIYPFLEGKYSIDNMILIVCRGTGTWGPPMRLFYPGEILHITLKRKI
ncbi:MAG: metallophosphoesterase [Bacteriovoracaceae bacterium]|nr:metallophosphoesterase [Bacteriovoracaceae bacterium]